MKFLSCLFRPWKLPMWVTIDMCANARSLKNASLSKKLISGKKLALMMKLLPWGKLMWDTIQAHIKWTVAAVLAKLEEYFKNLKIPFITNYSICGRWLSRYSWQSIRCGNLTENFKRSSMFRKKKMTARYNQIKEGQNGSCWAPKRYSGHPYHCWNKCAESSFT